MLAHDLASASNRLSERLDWGDALTLEDIARTQVELLRGVSAILDRIEKLPGATDGQTKEC